MHDVRLRLSALGYGMAAQRTSSRAPQGCIGSNQAKDSRRQCENVLPVYIGDLRARKYPTSKIVISNFSAESILNISKDLEMTGYKTSNDLNGLNQLKLTE